MIRLVAKYSIDRGIKKIQANLRAAGGSVVVGVIGDSGVATYASANEYGTDTIPARPFVRPSARDPRVRTFARDVSQKILAARESPKLALAAIGEFVRGLVVERIGSNVPPPNAPATIARKKSDKTLIDTGRLRQSITYQVRK